VPAVTKRLYDAAAAVPADGGLTVALDGRPVRTPAKAPLVVPGAALAEAIASEWAAQDAEVRPETMPLTRLANSAIDRVAARRAEVVDQVAAYGNTDLLCFRADAPSALVERQTAVWQPLVDWAAATLGASLRVTTGIVPVAQPPETLAALRMALEALDDFELGAVGQLTAATGSLVIALALDAGRLTPDEAFAASQLDETFQMEAWGEDDEALARRAALEAEIAAAARFLALHRAG